MSMTACSTHRGGVWCTCYRTGYHRRSGLQHFFPGLSTTRLRIVPPRWHLISWIPGAVIFQVRVFLSVHIRTSRNMGKSRGTFCRGIAIFWERSGSFISSKQMTNFWMWPPVLLCRFSWCPWLPAADTEEVFGVCAIVPATTEDLTWSISSQVYAQLPVASWSHGSQGQ